VPLAPPIPAQAAVPAQAPAAAPVAVEIDSAPRGADVFRLPSETKVGTTPWKAELPSEAGLQVFVVRKAGFAERRVEIDLRTGGTETVKLAKAPHRAAPPAPTGPVGTGAGQIRHKGEPVDPFRPQKP
jgi:hypothetical protein